MNLEATYFPLVIPGRREAASPESITTIVSMDSGPAPEGASRNDEAEDGYRFIETILSRPAARLAVNHIGALLEGGRKPRKGCVEHRAHQDRQHAALEFIGEEESDVAGVVAFRLEGPAILQTAERPLQIFDQDFQVGLVQRYLTGEGLPHQLERHGHVGHHDLSAIRLRDALADLQRLAQRHEFGIALDIGDEVEHLLRAVLNPE